MEEEINAMYARAMPISGDSARVAFRTLLALCKNSLINSGVIACENFLEYLDEAIAVSSQSCPECNGHGYLWEVPGDIRVPCETCKKEKP